MPKRMLSDAIWKSQKIRAIQPPELRVEYAWIMPIVSDNGCFEYDPEALWAEAYATARPRWTVEKVRDLLGELINVGLLHKYEVDGREYCYLVGSDREGYLPPPSQRYSKVPLPPDYAEPRAAKGIAVTGSGTGQGSGFRLEDGIGIGSSPESSPVPVSCPRANSKSKSKPSKPELPKWRMDLDEDPVKIKAVLDWCENISDYWKGPIRSLKAYRTAEAQYDRYIEAQAEGEKQVGDEAPLSVSKAFEIDEGD
jgi:hypothetical protein